MINLFVLGLSIVDVFVHMCHGPEVCKPVIARIRVVLFSLRGEVAIQPQSIYGDYLSLGQRS